MGRSAIATVPIVRVLGGAGGRVERRPVTLVAHRVRIPAVRDGAQRRSARSGEAAAPRPRPPAPPSAGSRPTARPAPSSPRSSRGSCWWRSRRSPRSSSPRASCWSSADSSLWAAMPAAVRRSSRSEIPRCPTVAGLALVGAWTLGSPCDSETGYYCVSIETDADRASGRALVLDDLRHSYVDLDDPTHLDFWYTRRMARGDRAGRRRPSADGQCTSVEEPSPCRPGCRRPARESANGVRDRSRAGRVRRGRVRPDHGTRRRPRRRGRGCPTVAPHGTRRQRRRRGRRRIRQPCSAVAPRHRGVRRGRRTRAASTRDLRAERDRRRRPRRSCVRRRPRSHPCSRTSW